MISLRKLRQTKCLLCFAALFGLSWYALLRSFSFQSLFETASQAFVHAQSPLDADLLELKDFEEDTIYAGIERRQRDIKRHLAEYCQANHDHNLRLPSFYRFQVIESPQIMYCMVPKVASRQWRATLKQLRLVNQQVRTNLQQYNASDIWDYLSRSYKFVFVREPFERLLSAYKDKFVSTRTYDRYYLETYGRKIIAKFRPDATHEALQAGDDVTFPEFIEYILKDGVHEGLNWHWNTYENQCKPCSLNYDFIGRFEFLSQDANYVLRKTGIYNLTWFPSANYTDTRFQLLKYYSEIPLEWIVQLGRVYRSSFEMFGYPFPGPLKVLFGNATGMDMGV